MVHWLGYIGGGLFGLFIVWMMIAGLRRYAQFLRWPPKLWRDDVLRMETAVRRRIAAERVQLQRSGVADTAQEKALSDQAFLSFLTGISVEQLDAYPGIGPATISKLRDAGYISLDQMQV